MVHGQQGGKGRCGKADVKTVSQNAPGLRRVSGRAVLRVIAVTVWSARGKAALVRAATREGHVDRRGGRLSASNTSRESQRPQAGEAMVPGCCPRVGKDHLMRDGMAQSGGSHATIFAVRA